MPPNGHERSYPADLRWQGILASMKIPVTIIAVIVGLFVLAHTWDAFKPGRYFGEFSFLRYAEGGDPIEIKAALEQRIDAILGPHPSISTVKEFAERHGMKCTDHSDTHEYLNYRCRFETTESVICNRAWSIHIYKEDYDGPRTFQAWFHEIGWCNNLGTWSEL